jgi:hypothetical protein
MSVGRNSAIFRLIRAPRRDRPRPRSRPQNAASRPNRSFSQATSYIGMNGVEAFQDKSGRTMIRLNGQVHELSAAVRAGLVKVVYR